MFGWIHKNGKSRPNKNKAKGAGRTCAQKNASRKRKKKKWEDLRHTGISGELFLRGGWSDIQRQWEKLYSSPLDFW